MFERIIPAFQKNFPGEQRSRLWEWCHQHSGQVPLTEENLDNMANTNLIWGFFGGTVSTDNHETLVKLAQAVGMCGIQNPENGFQIFPKANVEGKTDSEIIDLIESKIGFKIELPQFVGGRDTLITDRGIITDRHCHYLWIMKRILELCPDRNSRIIEIGAGIGLLGYYLDKCGYKDYTIVDLAATNVCQSYFLWKNLPHRNFMLSGEWLDWGLFHNSIKIAHTSDWEKTIMGGGKYDLMINIDGLTEMNIEDAKKYANSDCAELFLSINHEVNDFRVCEIVEAKEQIYRYPFWLRQGYVEECYTKTHHEHL